ncbi:Nucleoid occlusion protein [subsurface metagenome]
MEDFQVFFSLVLCRNLSSEWGLPLKKKKGKKKMEIVNIPIKDITISKYNVRKSMDEEELENLANSIRENELLQAIIVTKRNGNKYELIAGQRRYFACKDKLLWTKIPARILPGVSDLKIITLSTVENLQRINLSQVEKMDAFSTIYKMYKEDVKMVAKTTGYATQTIQVYLDLQEKLNESIKQDIVENKIVVGTKTLVALTKNPNISKEEQREVLKEMVGVKNQEQQIELIQSITDEKTRKIIVDGLRSSEVIQELALKVYLHRAHNINDGVFEVLKNLISYERELINRFKKLGTISPLYSIFLDTSIVKHSFFGLEMMINESSEDLESFYREKIRFYEYRSDKLLDLIIKDFKKNKDDYSNEFILEISGFLKNIQTLGVFQPKIIAFLKLLKSD